MNESLREKRFITEAFPINVHSCKSVYHYRKGIDGNPEMYSLIINYQII